MEGCGSEMLQIACKWEVVTLKCCNAGNSMQIFFWGERAGYHTIGGGGRFSHQNLLTLCFNDVSMPKFERYTHLRQTIK